MGEATNSLLKTIAGLVIVAVGIAWYAEFFSDLAVLVKGSVGGVLILIGLLWAWMSYEDFKMARESGKEKE
ncbi:MAG: hypothetical protein ACE5G7_05335 [Candidatus Hydrothermarchaeaceae archaeon]